MSKIAFSVFTKPWKTVSVGQLGENVSRMGFDGIEFPLRPGYQVEPAGAVQGLPALVRSLADHGLKVLSVAAALEERVFEACALAGVPVIRVMANFGIECGYFEAEAAQRAAVEAAAPLCRRYGVMIGVQHHFGAGVSNSMELLHFLDGLDPQCVGAVWDAAHSALAGEDPEQGLDILWPRLCMVNLKNACYAPVNGPDPAGQRWERVFTKGGQGLGSWRRAAEFLKSKQYGGTVCLTAEYTEEHRVDEYAAEDLKLAKSLF